MKVNVGADTSQFSAGIKTARRELKDFEAVSNDALGAVGNAIGVDTGKLEQMASAARGLGKKMQDSGNESVKALGSVLTKINAVSVGIAGLGLAAATTAFKLLNDEATAFKNTVEGANIEMMTAAYVQTYTNVLHDFNRATGQATAEIGAQVERALKGAWASVKSAVLATLTGGAPNLAVALAQQLPASMVAGAAGEKAADLADQIYKIQRKISDELVNQSELDADIAEYKRIATDASESMAERTRAAAEAAALIKQKYEGPDGIIALNNQLANLMEQMLKFPGSTAAEYDAVNQQKIKANNLIRQEQQELKALSRTQNTLTAAAAKEAEERAKARAELEAAAKAIADSRAALAALDLSTTGDLSELLPSSLLGPENALEIKVKPKLDESATVELTNEITALAASLSSAIGGLIGDLATGGDAWGNFKNAALSAFADMAIAVGKLTISTGVAMTGIQAALKLDNPYTAIAAGVALVALGAAVKSGLSNIAAGNYSASASVASAGYGSQRSAENGGWALREMNVNVTGTLKADGDQLITVINNTNKRNSYTQ